MFSSSDWISPVENTDRRPLIAVIFRLYRISGGIVIRCGKYLSETRNNLIVEKKSYRKVRPGIFRKASETH